MTDFRAENFGWRHRIVSAVSRRCQGLVYTSRSGLTKGLKRKGGLGFLPDWLTGETAETAFLHRMDFGGKVVFDIGGFQGLMTLFFAKTARQVVTFEAMPESVLRIRENAELNAFRNVLVRNVAVGAADGVLELYMDPLMKGAASGDPEIAEHIASSGRESRKITATLTTVDGDMERYGHPAPDFVKIDVEGMELDVLEGMRQLLGARRPDLYLELHGTTAADKQRNAAGVIDFVRERGYRVFDVERGRDVTGETATGHESHIYCRVSD